jgi:hypothetical protein
LRLIRGQIRELVFRFGRDNPRWGYQPIVGELKGLGMAISATTVRTWLREEGLRAAGTCRRRSQARLVSSVAIVSVVHQYVLAA